MRLVLSRHLAAAADRTDAEDGFRRWVAELPAIVSDLLERWELRATEPYQPGGQCSWVAPVVDAAGVELVLKVGWWHYEAEHEADALRFWAGDGAVVVHAAEAIGATSALLLERCYPGTPLGHAMSEPDQDRLVAGLLRRLWRTGSGEPFRPLWTMCDEWADEFEERSEPRLDPGLAREAMVLFRELPRTSENTVLLCTDLHAANVLAAEREPWLVIDPKPYLGDPTYDALQHMLNCPDRLTADPAGFAARMAALLDLDAARLRLWLFARCVQESSYQPVLANVAVRLRPS